MIFYFQYTSCLEGSIDIERPIYTVRFVYVYDIITLSQGETDGTESMDYFTQICDLNSAHASRYERKIGLFGGTFNPVHLGHVYMARQVYREFKLDKVVFIPVGDPPHKRNDHVEGKEHRFAMLQIALSGLDGFEVSRVELDREGSTYTIDTLTLLKKQMTGCKFYFIVGADNIFEIVTWKRYEEVLKLTEFICFYRPGYEKEKVFEYMRFYQEKYGKEILLSEYTGINVSSKEVRKKLQEGESVKGLVGEGVEHYIKENGLYR